jgi:hypothetical protein
MQYNSRLRIICSSTGSNKSEHSKGLAIRAILDQVGLGVILSIRCFHRARALITSNEERE